MATVCAPELVWPDHLIAQEAMVAAVADRRRGLPHLDRGLQVMRNTEVATRRMLRSLEDTLDEQPFGERNQLYATHAVRLGAAAGRRALAAAGVEPMDVDALVVVSCTGYMLPGPDAHIAGELGLRSTARRLPIQQLGCAAGGTALAQAHDFLLAHPRRPEDGRPCNVLVIAVELCSLSYQPGETSISDFISAALFGDGAAAAVVRGDDRAPGLRLVANRQHLVPGSTQVIAGTTSEGGFHFATNPKVRTTVPRVVPVVEHFLEQHGTKPGDLELVICHTGGPAVLRAVADGLDLEAELLDLSWQSLGEVGNVSSVVVLDVLRRTFDQRRPRHGATGLILAFGPGFTTEMLLCSWNEP
ncbi:MAG TPA: 3-oxoacyl-[acyl-carrier-protein] synthase III C-terminal domain-containing protein [Actinomycetota bacterium]|jgi:1,3,6,8-tetrahydroxynaphthalene synthase|nr:3-oxoacyl-[acyl-carrier-protein] synthase III C-terminal domain-containing protein [Actinomycetota bacterium]